MIFVHAKFEEFCATRTIKENQLVIRLGAPLIEIHKRVDMQFFSFCFSLHNILRQSQTFHEHRSLHHLAIYIFSWNIPALLLFFNRGSNLIGWEHLICSRGDLSPSSLRLSSGLPHWQRGMSSVVLALYASFRGSHLVVGGHKFQPWKKDPQSNSSTILPTHLKNELSPTPFLSILVTKHVFRDFG
jgi:hypothetical protein